MSDKVFFLVLMIILMLGLSVLLYKLAPKTEIPVAWTQPAV